MSHTLKMLVGCVLPLLLLFLLPLFGLGEGITLFVAIILMFACHLLMIRGHEHQSTNQSDKGDRHAQS
jgi:hypothetical protein